MDEVSDGIFRIEQRGRFDWLTPPANIYVIPGPNGLIFDAGYGSRRACQQLRRGLLQIAALCRKRKIPFELTRILPSHTHPDHFAGLRAVRRQTGARILLTPKMAGRIRSRRAYRRAFEGDGAGSGARVRPGPARRALRVFETRLETLYEKACGIQYVPCPDQVVAPRSCLRINKEAWQLFPSPGHSDDHISLYQPDRGVLLGGDNVLRSVTTWLGPPCSDLADYARSLRRMLALDRLDLILPAHGSPVTRPRARIREILRWREARTRQVLDQVFGAGPGGIGFEPLLRRIYRGEGWGKWYMAEGWVRLTLAFLMDRGYVERVPEKGKILFAGKGPAPSGRERLGP